MASFLAMHSPLRHSGFEMEQNVGKLILLVLRRMSYVRPQISAVRSPNSEQYM